MEDLNKHNPKKLRRYKTSVESYLEKYRVGSGPNIKYNLVGMGEGFTGKFMLDKNSMKEFYKLYGEAYNYGLTFSLAEKPKDYGPHKIDIDLEKPLEDWKEGERLYDEEMIKELINVHREVMCEYLDLEPRELVASVFEKPLARKTETTVKDGIHIIFHGITIHYKLGHVIRYHVIKKLSDNPRYNQFTKSLNEIIDKAVINTNCWLLPGSRKKDGQVYELTNIYDDENNPIDITKTLADKYKMIKLYALQDKLRCKDNASIYLENVEFEDIEEEYTQIAEKPQYNYNFENVQPSKNKEDEIRKAQYLVSLLSDERNETFESWIRIGWALHNIDNSLLSTWIEFSKKWPKFKEGECEEKWYRMRNEGLTIRSLMYWAEEDNYIKYHEFMKAELQDVLNQGLDGSTYFLGKALYTKFMNRFVCASMKSNAWYEFKNHRWFPIHDGYTLKKEISESFVNEYLDIIDKLNKKAKKAGPGEKDDAVQKAIKVQNIVKQLMNISFKDKLMKEAVLLFHDPEFEKKLDDNLDLVGFNNGVYDLSGDEFRDGRPDDYISKTTNVDYYPFKESNPYTPKMFKFFEEILPNENVRKYLLLSLASCMSGYNKEEKLRIATGSGSNGKSLLFSLVQMALGDYYISCPITIITRKRNSSNSASPELLRIKGARCGCFQETDDGEKLNVGIMKEITGNDSFMVRGLYSDPVEIKPQIKFWLACNQLPELPSVDGGVKRRLCNIEFKSKFVETPVKSNEYLIDNMLKQKIKDWAPLFASYLIHLYTTEYKKLTILTEPEEIKLSTQSYIAENDHFTEYTLLKLVYTGDKADCIQVKEMYDDFRVWFKGSRDVSAKCPNQSDFNKSMNEKIGDSKNFKWKGYKFSNGEKQVESDDDDDPLNG
jgi:P4 family phage/plasmid primase-like protien